MTTAVFTLGVLEQIAYMVLLGRLISMTKEKRPVLFGALGAPAAWDYLVFGFGPGDRFISKLEVHRDQILEEPQLLRLIQVVRGLYVAFLLTVLAWVFVIVSHANLRRSPPGRAHERRALRRSHGARRWLRTLYATQMMGTARRAVYTAAALTALTVLTLPGNPHRGMGFFELLALPLWLPFFSGRDWPDWQFLPAAAAAIFVWLWAWTFAAYWVISRVQKRKRNGI